MSANSYESLCFTTQVVFLEPTEQDVIDNIVYCHPELVVQAGSRVQIVEMYEHGLKFWFRGRVGIAPMHCFSIVTETVPAIQMEQEVRVLRPTPTKHVNFERRRLN